LELLDFSKGDEFELSFWQFLVVGQVVRAPKFEL
jgi:hypothetical protein